MNAALWWLNDDDFYYGTSKTAVAKYYYIRNDMEIPKNPDPYDVFHEAIHVYNDWVDTHEDARTDEGLAYAATGMAKGLERLQRLEKELNAANPEVKILRMAWMEAWLAIDQVGWPAEYNKIPFNITVQDVRLVNTYLGFKARCQDIAALYNNQPGAKGACVEFLCDPNAKASTGRIGVTPKRSLSEPFK